MMYFENMKLSKEAYNLIIELLEQERDLQTGHEDRIEYINTVIDEVNSMGIH